MKTPSSVILPAMPKKSAKNDYEGSVAPTTSRRMVRTAQRDNTRERSLRSELHRRGLRFRLHRKPIEGSRRSVDIAFLSQRVAVFLDGCFWHGCPKHGTWPKNNAEWWRTKIETNIQRDLDTDRRLKQIGWIARESGCFTTEIGNCSPCQRSTVSTRTELWPRCRSALPIAPPAFT